jgi:hypothetical protein|tara:strand:+ start:324 stop:869 length:546 start_codon:yes stop_codon:yes gene_type:complete
MSQQDLDVIRGIAQAAAHMYDGALDENGDPVKIGLKRDEGHPVLDSRTMDGCKIKINGNQLIVNYQSEITLKDVHANGFESEMDQTCEDIANWLKKQYKKVTGDTLSLKALGDCDAMVQQTSRVRVFVNAQKSYEITNLKNVEGILQGSDDRKVDPDFENFLKLGGLGNKAENKNQRVPKS